jgi:thioredoxin-like negative regulator of GroEL
MGTVFNINAGNWEQEVLKSDILTVVDFWHDRCPWCIRLDPIINEVAREDL